MRFDVADSMRAQKVWDSGIGLSSWICGLAESHPDSEPEAQMRHVLLSPGKRRIVELGEHNFLLASKYI